MMQTPDRIYGSAHASMSPSHQRLHRLRDAPETTHQIIARASCMDGPTYGQMDVHRWIWVVERLA